MTGYAIQGNILAGVKVVPAMEKAFLKTEGNLPKRLHAALLAGDRAGGDKAAGNPRRSMWSAKRRPTAASSTVGSIIA